MLLRLLVVFLLVCLVVPREAKVGFHGPGGGTPGQGTGLHWLHGLSLTVDRQFDHGPESRAPSENDECFRNHPPGTRPCSQAPSQKSWSIAIRFSGG